MIRIEITIRLKKGVEDPEGLTVTRTLKLLNFKTVKKTYVLKTYEILVDSDNLEETRKQAEEMCDRLFVNPVIHEYDIKLEYV